jgi:hypothetical protein
MLVCVVKNPQKILLASTPLSHCVTPSSEEEQGQGEQVYLLHPRFKESALSLN